MTPSEGTARSQSHHISRRALALGAVTAGAAGVFGIPAAAASHAPASLASSASRPTAGEFHESTIFEAGDHGLAVFHVFGLAETTAGTILAFAEGRITAHDADPHHIVAKRSTDGGRTWGEIQYVRETDGVRALINPTPLVDRDTGRIFLLFADCFRDPGNTGGSPDRSDVYLISSDDDGLTWSEPTELTSMFDGNPHGWTLHMPGPGHGLQLSDGRLVFQVWHRRAIAFPVPERRYGVSVIYSDDAGDTWTEGGSVPLDGAYPLNESRLIERPDGSLVNFGRYASGGTHPRIVSISTDRGESWSDPVLDASARPVNAVDTGISRISGGVGSDEPSRIVFSRPDSPTRRNMTVSISYDEGMTWPHSRVLTDGPASYSDTIGLSDGRIGVLYGREHAPGITKSFSAKIVLATFDLAWLTSGADTGSSGDRLQLTYEAEELAVLDSAGGESPSSTIRPRVVDGGWRSPVPTTAPSSRWRSRSRAPVTTRCGPGSGTWPMPEWSPSASTVSPLAGRSTPRPSRFGR